MDARLRVGFWAGMEVAVAENVTVTLWPPGISGSENPVFGLADGKVAPLTLTLPGTKVKPTGRISLKNTSVSGLAQVSVKVTV